MAAKKADLDLAPKQASTGFLEALCLVEKFLDPSFEEERTLIASKVEGMFPGRICSPAIYSKVMWFTSEVSAQVCGYMYHTIRHIGWLNYSVSGRLVETLKYNTLWYLDNCNITWCRGKPDSSIEAQESMLNIDSLITNYTFHSFHWNTFADNQGQSKPANVKSQKIC